MFRLQTPTIKTRAASQHINHPLLTHLHPIRLIVHVAHHFTNSVKNLVQCEQISTFAHCSRDGAQYLKRIGAILQNGNPS
jgi:hypothetical protein